MNPIQKQKKIIGIVGGLGPQAGLDIMAKILKQSKAKTDQENIEFYYINATNIGDRSTYLLDPEQIENPAIAISQAIEKLNHIGANIYTIACNTAHSAIIYDEVIKQMQKRAIAGEIVHLIKTVYNEIKKTKPWKKIGLLATLGTYHSKIYSSIWHGIQIITPSETSQKILHQAIYDQNYGIKSHAKPVTSKAKADVLKVAQELLDQKVEAIIMGCTEIPLVLKNEHLPVEQINPNLILARFLIQLVSPEKLKIQ